MIDVLERQNDGMRKRLLIICMLLPCMCITGCGVKFIEVAQIEKQEVQTGDLPGDVKDAPEKTEITVPKEEDEKTEKVPEVTETPEETVEDDDVFKMHGMNFKKVSPEKSMYLKYTNHARNKPGEDGEKVSVLYKGDTVSLFGISEDGLWGIVRDAGGPQRFIEMDSLTEEYVEKEKDIGTLGGESEEQTAETENPSDTDKKPEGNGADVSYAPIGGGSGTNEANPPAETSTDDDYYSDDDDEYWDGYDYGSGIAFPENADSTSIVMDVEFAEVSLTVYARDNAPVSDGPGMVGIYMSLGTARKGESMQCTGIGRNGYVRVEFRGNIGFIDSRLVDVE